MTSKGVWELEPWPPVLPPVRPPASLSSDPGHPLTLQAVHLLVSVVLVITVQIVPVAVHQQDGSIPAGPPDPIPLPMAKHNW